MRAVLVAAAVLLAASTVTRADDLSEAARTARLVRMYKGTKHWSVRSLVLLSLGAHWHPAGDEAVLDALEDGNHLLRAFAIETLHRTDPTVLRSVLSKPLVTNLVRLQLAAKNDYYRQRVLKLLVRAFPYYGGRTWSDWTRWWSWIGGRYQPTRWVPPAGTEVRRGRTVAMPLVRRVLDLHDAGLDLVICIDSTGSMQPTIDMARDAIGRIVAVLGAVAPKLRLGLVHYRDLDDMSDGAKRLVPLTRHTKTMKKALAGIQAGGGGDTPERVEKGLELAYSRAMGWKRSTNKVVILIGDSPPHKDAIETAKKLARRAYIAPFGKPGGSLAPTTPSGRTTARARPIVTSAISVGGYTKNVFGAIAQAGGGTWALLPVRGGKAGAEASDRVAKHILALAFGSRWSKQLDAFVEILYAYRSRGLR